MWPGQDSFAIMLQQQEISPRMNSHHARRNALNFFVRVVVFSKNHVIFLAALLLLPRSAAALLPFPTEALPGTEISSNWPPNFEPSGAVWHTGLERLLVALDNGYVASMDPDGSNLTDWAVGGDLEGITVADPSSPFVYVGLEHPDSILEMNLNTGQVTRTFDVTAWMTGPSNQGLEALTFVHDPNSPEGGLFYAGLQNDGRIYSFRLPIASSSTSTSVTHLSVITPVGGRTDLSGLHYDDRNEVLYAIFDRSNRLRAMEANGQFLSEWTLAGRDQEGIAMAGDRLFITEDSGDVVRYEPFPFLTTLSAVDFNNDGTVGAADYTLWQDGLGDTTVEADYLLWKTHFGESIASGSEAENIPEPATLLLALLVVATVPHRLGCF